MKAIVLLSGGLDSAVNLYWAVRQYEVTTAMFFDYGQRAVEPERKAAAWLCSQARVPLKELPLPWLRRITHTALVNKMQPLPQLQSNQLDDATLTHESAKNVWVPNRNGLFIQIAACYADAYGVDRIIVGFNREEGATFPDNTAEFMATCDAALNFSTQVHPKVESYTINMDKTEIAKAGVALGLDLSRVWSCYEAGPEACGQCESCLRQRRALAQAGLV